VAVLHQRTEGWPAGLYLAALYLREGGSLAGAAGSFGGGDRLVSEYIESEFLALVSRRQRTFLTRAAVLERMSAPLCEAVLELPGAAAMLAESARSNLLLVPLDRHGQWYRYHHLLRDMLLGELERLEPGLMPALRRRAAGWCQRNDLPEEALEYSFAAGDTDATARLVQELWLPTYRQGHVATLHRWFRWLDERGAIEAHPMVTVAAAIVSAVTGHGAEAERWADAVDRWQYGNPAPPADPSTEAWAAFLRAGMGRRGAEQMRADADEAVRRFAAAGIAAPQAAHLHGLALIYCGDPERADAAFQDTVNLGQEDAMPEVVAEALSARALLAITDGEWDRAEVLARHADTMLRRAGIDEALIYAVQARIAAHQGDASSARRELARATCMRPQLTYAQAPFAVLVRIELIRVHLALADVAGARTVMQEVDELLQRQPDLGTLVSEAQALRARLPTSTKRGSNAPGASTLTTAELRLLPMLTTHMPVSEIAAELFLSPHTVKGEMKSIYRKLGASTRSQAVARSRDLGLLEG
jgi:LuxR family maltose regulon positive regulatory protein